MKNGILTERKMTFDVNIFYAFVIIGLPLIFTDGYYNITETKSIFFYIVSVAFILLFLIKYLVVNRKIQRHENKSIIKRLNLCDCAMLLFCFSVLLSSLLSKYQSDVWFGSNSRYQGAVTVFLYVCVYFIASRYYKKSQVFLLCTVIAVSVVSFIGMLNCFDIDFLGIYGNIPPGYKASYISTIGNINFYSSYLCITFPLIFCGFSCTQNALSRIIYTSALIIVSFCMPVSGSESFVVGLIFSILIFTFFLLYDSIKLKKFMIAVIISILSAQGFMLIYRLSPQKNVKPPELLNLLLNPYITVGLCIIIGIVALLLHLKPESLKVLKILYYVVFILFVAAIPVLFILGNKGLLGSFNKYFVINDTWGTYRVQFGDSVLKNTMILQ